MLSTYGRIPIPPLLRVHSEIAGMFVDEMDLVSLSRWRATCKINYQHGSLSLRRTLTSCLRPFVAYPHQLVDIVTSHGAVFRGELALSFILRQQPYRPSFLEIYASNYQYDLLCDAILDDPTIHDRIENHTFTTYPPFHALRRLVVESLVIHTTNGKTIYVHQSYTSSPCGPISRAPCTALSNYVSGYGFGCSHPELTLAQRALLANRDLFYISPHDSQTHDRLITHNFSLEVSPTAWAPYRSEFDGAGQLTANLCWRHRYICPNQGRYFGDNGSLVGFFDPLGGDTEQCMKKNIAPFGPMVIWRVMSTFECDDGCEYLDEVLEQGVTSVPVLFIKDPFGELWNCISERSMQPSAFHHRFGRHRSSSI